MVRASLNDLDSGDIDRAICGLLSVLAAIREDGAPPLAIAPGGTIDGAWVHELELLGPDPEGRIDAPLLILGEPLADSVGLTDLFDGTLRLREINARDVATDPLPAAAGDRRPDGIGGD
ncbi:MAG: hypothetical protein FWC87_01150 [Acidimicrobiaceae bacterium]|nr:hypothetical protein [Acidimicrobiaceae bacterium]